MPRKKKRKKRVRAGKKLLGLVIVIVAIAVIAGMIFLLGSKPSELPKPAEFVVSDLTITPTEPHLGETITVTTYVKNIGEVEGWSLIVLRIDEATEQTENVTLAGGGTKTVTFTFTKNVEGFYNIGIGGLNQSLLSQNLRVKIREITLPPVESVEPLFQRRYEWRYENSKYLWDVAIPNELYEYCENRPRPPTKNYSVYVTDPRDDQFLRDMAMSFNQLALEEGLSENEKISLMMAWVQSLPYTSDNVTTPHDDYPRYPAETLVDEGGDCEDTSILMASLLDEIGYEVILINPPGHVAVGVSGKGIFRGWHWTLDSKEYYYLETTGEGWKIGEIPEEYEEESAHLYHIEPVPILTHTWTGERRYNATAEAELTVTVKNEGTAAARNVFVEAGYDTGENTVPLRWWNPEKSEFFDLAPDSEKTIVLLLREPRGEHTRFIVQTVYEGCTVDESYSEWFDT